MMLIAGTTAGWDRVFVHLNGEKLERCYMADDEVGAALVWLTDEERIVQGHDPNLHLKFVVGNITFVPTKRARIALDQPEQPVEAPNSIAR